MASADVRWRWGEYTMERTPEEIEDLRRENREQNDRIRQISDDVAVVRAGLEQNYRTMAKIESYLVGLDGKNGLRGELRQYQKQTQEQLDTVFVRINSIGVNMLKTVSGIIGALGGITGVVYALYRIFTGEL